MADESENKTAAVAGQPASQDEHSDDWQPPSSKLVRFYAHPWTQISLISMICFCLPGVSA